MTPEEKPRPETVSGRELTVTAGPHLRQGLSVSMMMYLTLAALIFRLPPVSFSLATMPCR